MKRIGIFAGTFDPVHKGHLSFCQAAATHANLDTVYLLPERSPRKKYDVTPLSDRLALLEQTVQTLPNIEVMTLGDSQFTVAETLPQLQDQFRDGTISLLLGSDVACGSLQYWDNLDILLANVELVIALRANSTLRNVEDAMESIQKNHGNISYSIIESPHPDVSSSQIRKSKMTSTR